VLIAGCRLSRILIRMMTKMVRWLVAADYLLTGYLSAGISELPEYRQNAHASVCVLLITEGTVCRST